MDVRVEQAGVLEWAQQYRGEKFHALLIAPPYEMGMLDQGWDRSGIAFQPETWAAMGEHLLPGAFCLAFASARGAHRLACAIEDAGYIIHPTIFGWVYGSGAPKATRIDTRVDKNIGHVGRDVVAIKKRLAELFAASGKTREQIDRECGFRASNYLTLPAEAKRPDPWVNALPSQEKWAVMKRVLGCEDSEVACELDRCFAEAPREVIGQQTKARSSNSAFAIPTMVADAIYQTWDITAPASELARAWTGHHYGRQALRPAFEPIILFQKPYEGKPIEAIARSGAGALNIDDTRIAGPAWTWGTMTDIRGGGYNSKRPSDGHVYARNVESNPAGLWPANLVLQHLPGCRQLGTDKVRSRRAERPETDEGRVDRSQWRFRPTPATSRGYGDDDGFEIVEEWECQAGCPVAAIDRQSGTGRGAAAPVRRGHRGESRGIYGDFEQKGDDGKTFYGDTVAGGASKFYYRARWASEIEEHLALAEGVCYTPKPGRSEKDAGLEGHNSHPTVKPVSLARWLATLLLPPAAYSPRRILVPFAGTGTECIGAALAGWEIVLGIEREAEFAEMAQARLRHWLDG